MALESLKDIQIDDSESQNDFENASPPFDITYFDEPDLQAFKMEEAIDSIVADGSEEKPNEEDTFVKPKTEPSTLLSLQNQ